MNARHLFALALSLLTVTTGTRALAGSRGLRPGERVTVGDGQAIGTIVDIAGHEARLTLERPYPCTNCDRTVVGLSGLFRETRAIGGFRVGEVVGLPPSVRGTITDLFENGTAVLSLHEPYPCTNCTRTVVGVKGLQKVWSEGERPDWAREEETEATGAASAL